MLNNAQRRLARAGLGLFLTQGLFPPWELRFNARDHPSDVWPEGFAFLLKPPRPYGNAYQYHAPLSTNIDWAMLVPLWSITVLMTVAFCLLFVKRLDESDDSFFDMLQSRKSVSSLLIGSCFPMPLFGYPAIFTGVSLLKGGLGFESRGWILLTWYSFLAFAGFSFLFLVALQRAKSNLVRKTLIVSIALALFAASFATPVIKNYTDPERQERSQ